MMFDIAWVRFATSGTLITVYAIVDHLARRRRPRAGKLHASGWTKLLVFVSIGAFYLLIGPTGGPLFGGAGNLSGFALVAIACIVRARSLGPRTDVFARGVFYLALPLAVGVPWGLLALSVPATLASALALARHAAEVPPGNDELAAAREREAGRLP
jgi:hypothetical protein